MCRFGVLIFLEVYGPVYVLQVSKTVLEVYPMSFLRRVYTESMFWVIG